MAKKTGKAGAAAKKPAKQKVTPPPAKPIKQPRRLKRQYRLPNAWQLTKAAWSVIWQHKRLFIGITLVYGLLNLILVQGLASNTDVTSLKNTLNHAFSGQFGSLASGLSIFAILVGSAGNGSSQTAGAYQLF